MNLNYSDMILIAKLLFSEADKNHELIVKDGIAIAHVVKNRLASGRWGDTIEKVIFAPKQFSGVDGNEWNKTTMILSNPKQSNTFDVLVYGILFQVTEAVFEYKYPDPTGGANHYFNPRLCNPIWAHGMKITYNSGAHLFLRG